MGQGFAMDNELLDIYRSHPMDDGDVVVLVEELKLATEIKGLAKAWDDVLCRNLASVLREVEARQVELGIARPHEALQDGDHRLLADLRNELADSGITVHNLIALPAALSHLAA
jgi:hypothetical protein